MTIVSPTDMTVFTTDEIKRAGELLRCPLDEASAIRALVIQRDTGLSIARGEISIVPFAGKPTVMINKQGYLAYATRQPVYDGYESSVYKEGDEWVAECSVFHKSRRPTTVRIYQKEFAKQTPIWKEKPRYMLEKTAISLALRAAFPILSGTYEEGEIEPDSVKIEQKPTDIKIEPDALPSETKTTTGNVPTPEPVAASEPEPVKQPIDKCPVCGKEPMVPTRRKEFETAFQCVGYGEVPAGLCEKCARDLWKQKMTEEKK